VRAMRRLVRHPADQIFVKAPLRHPRLTEHRGDPAVETEECNRRTALK
jgi:hypothetical protein